MEVDKRYFSVQALEVDDMKKAGTGSNTNLMYGNGREHVLEDIEIEKTDRQCQYSKAKALESYKTDGTDDAIKSAIYGETTFVFTDKGTFYLKIRRLHADTYH